MPPEKARYSNSIFLLPAEIDLLPAEFDLVICAFFLPPLPVLPYFDTILSSVRVLGRRWPDVFAKFFNLRIRLPYADSIE